MDPRKLARLEKLFEQSLELPAHARPRFVEENCADDPQLADELRSLLDAHESAGEFLEPPTAAGSAGTGDAAPESASGQMAGTYRLMRRIGEGGMSEVYLAVRADDEFKKRVAVKVIRDRPDREDVVQRFRTERQILAGLDHPNIARLLDGGTLEDGRPFLAMDFIEGVPIDEYCDRERLPIEQRLELFRTVCSAVHFAHRNLVVHRDIKPSNILVGADGQPKLLDFGIAKLLKPDQFAENVDLTRTSYRPMTPRWASPEQLRGDAVTTSSDVYSLGALLYKLLTGHLPHSEADAKTPSDQMRRVLEEEPTRPSDSIDRTETVPDRKGGSSELTAASVSRARNLAPAQLKRRLAGDLDNIVLMALRKEPNRRYGSVEQFSEDVRRYLAGLPVIARPDTFTYRFNKFLRRNALPVAAVAAFVVLLAGSAVFLAIQSARIAEERDQARLERDRAETVLSLLQRVFEVSDPGQSGGQELTAREILERGARQVRQELADQPEIRASVMRSIGNVYSNLGMYDQARDLLREALETRKSLGGAPELVAQSMRDLGNVERIKGNFDEAERLLQDSLAMQTTLTGELETKLALGQLAEARGDFAGSGRLLQEVIDEHRASGLETETLAAAMNYLAITASEQGDFPTAERLLEQVAPLRRRLHGDNHPGVAEAMGDLGVVLGIQGKLEESKELLTESLVQRRRLLDPDHPAIGEGINNLARVHRELGNYEESEKLTLESIDILKRKLGPRHARVATTLHNLAALKYEMGDLDEAQRYARECLAIREQAVAPGSYDMGAIYLTLGRISFEQGEVGRAERELSRALPILQESVGDSHWRTGLARVQLARIAAARGDEERARDLYEAGIAVMRDSLGPEHRRTKAAAAAFEARTKR